MNTSQEQHVVFGTGPLGAAVMRGLLRRGKAVRMVTRTGKPSIATGLAPSVEFRSADANNAAGAAAAVAGATHVYQCAQPPYHRWPEQFPALQASILKATADAGATFVVAENLYMYGDTHGQPLTEDTPYRPYRCAKAASGQR